MPTSIFSDLKSSFLETQSLSRAFCAENKGLDKRTFTVIIIALFSLVFMQYFGIRPGYRMLVDILGNLHLTAMSKGVRLWVESAGNRQIHLLTYWVCVIAALYILVPVLVIKLILREKLSEYGLGIGQSFRHYKIYLLLLAVMFPVVIAVSFLPRFQEVYPFYKLSTGERLWPYFWTWQVLYFVQFVGVEFFFRGFILHGLKRRFGLYAILIMTIPYCMIHFGKPMPEAIGAIFAGLALGGLSIATRSIWMGVTLHYMIGFTMDIAAVWHRGLL